MKQAGFGNPLSNQTLMYQVTGDGKYIRETMDGPIYGHVILEASPRVEGGGLEIVSRITSAEIPPAVMPQIFEGIRCGIQHESTEQGVHFHVTIAIVGGSHAQFCMPSDAFKMAAIFAMKEILDKGEWVEME